MLTERQKQSIERGILKMVDKSNNRINIYTLTGKSRRKPWKTSRVMHAMLERGVIEYKDFRGLEVGRKGTP